MTGTMEKQDAMSVRRFKQYPLYRHSGVEWLGEIPAHWDARRLKFVSIVIMGQSPPSEQYNVLGDGLPFLQGNADFGTDHPDPQVFCPTPSKTVRPGDHLVSVRAPVGALNTADQRYGIGRGLCAVRIRPPLIDNRFARWVLSLASVGLNTIAVGSTYEAVSADDVSGLVIPLPEETEQRAIAGFLDRETARIDGLAAKKERLIELLQEKRAALITRAVTKGLDPRVTMKHSGVEWLGQVPAHWTVSRLKHITTGVEQGWSPLCDNRQADEDEWGVLKVGCVNGAEFDDTEHKALPLDEEPLPELEIRPGDILMSRANTRQLLGSAALVQRVRSKLLLCDKLYRIRARPEAIFPGFLVLAFSSSLSRFQFERAATGASASMQNISQQMLSELVLPCPPTREQPEIVEFVQRDTASLSKLIKGVGRAISRLKELRTALIAAAVTGKIDVRDQIV